MRVWQSQVTVGEESLGTVCYTPFHSGSTIRYLATLELEVLSIASSFHTNVWKEETVIHHSSSKLFLPLSLLYGGEASSKRTMGAGLARASRKCSPHFSCSNLSMTRYFRFLRYIFSSRVTHSAYAYSGITTQTFKASLVERKDQTELAGVRCAHFRI